MNHKYKHLKKSAKAVKKAAKIVNQGVSPSAQLMSIAAASCAPFYLACLGLFDTVMLPYTAWEDHKEKKQTKLSHGGLATSNSHSTYSPALWSTQANAKPEIKQAQHHTTSFKI